MTGSDFQDFTFQLDHETDEMFDEVREWVIRIGMMSARLLINRSPVDTGRFKGNWKGSVSSVINDPEVNTFDKVGTGTFAQILGVLNRYRALDTWPPIYIQNNVVYARALESGHSTQAPGGIMGITVVDMQAAINGGAI